MLIVAIAAHLYGLSINVTDSMPIGLYHAERVRLPIAKGTIVQTCLPIDIAGVGRRQGYLLGGPCPGDTAPVLKIVAAAGGDKVELLGQHVLVNGRTLSGSGTLTNDAHGRRLGVLLAARSRSRMATFGCGRRIPRVGTVDTMERYGRNKLSV